MPPIKAKAKFIAVVAQVLYRNLMVRAVDAALEPGEGVFDALRMVLALSIGNYVINHAVAICEVIAANPAMRETGIGLEQGFWPDVFQHVRLNRRRLVISQRN